MIDEDRTFAEFEYMPSELSHGSNKRVWAICNKCGKERLVYFKEYNKLCQSCSQLGRKFSKETRQKISEANTNKKLSEKTKQKISIAISGKNHPFFGKKLSEEHKRKMSNNHADFSGENNPNWRGGISSLPYCFKFNNNLKEYIRNRDNYTCQLCEKVQSKIKLSIHHIHYDKENCNPDLITLCGSCNSRVNFNRDYWEQYFMRLLFYNNNKIKVYNIESELNIWNYGKF